MTDAKKIALATSLDTRPVKDGFQEIVQAAESTAAGVKNASDRAGKAVDSIGTGADAAAKKIEGAERSIIASIQRRTAAVQAAGQSESKYYEELARQRGVNTDALRPYLQQLDAAKARQDAASASLGKMGVSAAQTAAALRGVPAQFTDIVTSIASGQQPLTVLLQQGGQLKDMFGGAGNAARALGGYVAGLINPFTIAAGAIGAVAVAAYQGASELQAFNKTLILSGNVSGVTSDRLMGMAAGMKAVNGSITQSKAVEALNLMIEAGVRGEQQLGRYAKAAVEFEKAGGGAAAEVAKQFAALAKDPLQASLKLNESMGYLSASVSETISSLENQGKTVEAARVAQNAYADAIENRTPQLVENIGYIESAWNGVTSAMAGAWDGLKDIGRAQSLTERYAETVGRLNAAQRSNTLGGGNGFDVTDPRTAADQRLAASLRRQIESQAVAADLTAMQAQREKERVAFLGQADKYLTSEQRQQREILAVQNLVTRQIITQEEAEKRIAAIRESNAKKSRTSRAARDEFGDVFNRVSMKDVGLDPSFYKDLNTLYDGYQKGRIGIDQYREAVEALVSVQRFAVEAQKAQTAAAIAAGQANNAAFDAEFESVEKKRLSVESQIKSGREMLEQIQFETSLLGMNTAQREQAIAMRDLERAGVVAGTQAYAAYAEQIKNAIASREQQQQMLSFWKDLDQTAESVFMDIAMNGEDAFKRIGKSIQREILQMLYEMTVKKWIIQIAGEYGGMGGGSGGNLLASAAQSYMTGGSAWGASANAAGAWASGSMSAANAYGSIYANATGTGMNGLLATNGAYGTAASGSAAGASSASWISAVGYVALIAAAVMVAQNLYAKGYNRAALGDGPGENTRFGYTNFTSDPNMGNSWQYNYADPGMSKFRRNVMDAVGMSEKWADIFSGTTRMATLFGRKLGAYGYEADIAGGSSEVGGFARYKGGLFRSNKTVGIDIDQRDTAAVDSIVESTIEGARAMARAMGLSEEAINSYTGSIKVNMKGAETAEEQSKRMAEAMDELQFSLLKAAAGGKYSKDEFEKMMEGVRKSIEAAGISTGGIADILVQGMTGRLSRADVGDQLADMIVGGIYNSIASNYAGVIAQAFTTQIITPIFTAIAAGVPISQAISQAAISNVVATAQSAAQALNAIFNDAGFRQAIGGIQQAISGVAGAVTSVKVPKFGSAARAGGGNQASQERYNLETELLNLLGNTNALRRRELASLSAGNRALQQRIWALEDARDGVNNAMEALERAADARRKVLQDQLDAAAESEQALKDVFDVLRDNLRDIRGEVTPQTSAAQGRALIREALGGEVVKADDLANAINAVRDGIDATQYGSRVERDRAMLLLAAELDTLAGSTEQGLSAAEQQVTLLEEQLEGIDSQLELAQKQVDALFGVDTSVKTVEQAVQALTVAMAGYSAAVAAAAAVKVSYGAAPGGSSGGGGGGGGFSTGGASASTGWTAGGYWAKNPDIRDYYTQNADWLSQRFGGRDKYLEWHWQNQGQKERRKFATGAAFTGGVVQRPTLFNIGQMGEAGPEGILPLANIGGRLGVMSSSDQETKKLLREVIARLDSVADNTEAGALHASRMASTLRKASREGGALAVQAAEGAPVKVEVIA